MGKKSILFDWIPEQFTNPPPLYADLTGKTVLVVGANTGIGFDAAKHFAQMGPKRLILGCRNETKGRNAIERIEQDTKFKAELGLVDLSSFQSVIDFAHTLENEPLDILVMNAAIGVQEYQETEDGWESSLQVNHLSTALLSFLLTPNLVHTAKTNDSYSRLVIVSSGVHYSVKFDSTEFPLDKGIIELLNDKQRCTAEVMARRYHDSKTLSLLFTRGYTNHLPLTTPLIPNCVDPGFCVSELRRNMHGITGMAVWVMEKLTARSSEQGSRQLLWAALGPDGKEGPHLRWLRGAYVSGMRLREPSDFVMSKEGKEAEDRIWNETIDILAKVAPQVRVIVGQYLNFQA